jgi:hypothetical protein
MSLNEIPARQLQFFCSRFGSLAEYAGHVYLLLNKLQFFCSRFYFEWVTTEEFANESRLLNKLQFFCSRFNNKEKELEEVEETTPVLQFFCSRF